MGAFMETHKSTRKKKKVVVVLILPILIFVFGLGWTLCWLDDQKKSQRDRPAKSKQNVILMPINQEELLASHSQ